VPLIGALFKAAFTGDLGQRIERLNEAMGLLAGACQGLGFRRLTVSSGEWLGLLGVLLGQPMAKVLPMRGQFLAEAVASSQMTFAGKRVEIETGAGQRFGTIFGVKSYPARTWARMLDALELPYDIVITNSFTPARNNEIEERIKRTARQMRASEDAAETLRQELYEAADNVASGRQVFGKHHLTVMVTAETPEQLEEAASEVWRAGQDCGATLVRESFAARAAWFAQAPGNWAYRPRTALLSAQNFAHLAALHRVTEGRSKVQSPWGETITALPTVTSSLYRFNFHDKGERGAEPSAGHTLVLGRTGSGKTLGTAFLMAQAGGCMPASSSSTRTGASRWPCFVFTGKALQRGKPSAPLPVGQRRRGRGRGLPALSRCTQLGLARRVLDDAAGKARRGEDVQPMRLADLGVKLAHHIEVQRGMTTDRQEPAFLDAMLVDHEMRMQMVGVLVQGSDIAPDIPILTGPEHSLPPFPGDDLGALGVHPRGKLRTM
jgi:hypothetical protein